MLNLGSLFGQSASGYPNYGYPSYPNYGYNYNQGYNYGYSRPSTAYYTSTGYYPNNYGGSGSYYPSTVGSGYYYPSSGNGYYPSTGNGYYPTTNILGTAGYGGYGGYGGNGGLRQYSGYWQPDYSGQRNRGYGYYAQTDRFGLPPMRERDYNYRDRGQSYGGGGGGYRGYD